MEENQNESIRDKNIRMMKEVLASKKAAMNIGEHYSKKMKKNHHTSKIKQTKRVIKSIKDSENGDEFKDII